MTEPGDIHLADLNEERRRRVLVVSNSRFNRFAARVIVVPEVLGEREEVRFPWRIEIGDGIYAVDLMRTVPAERLLERVARAPYESVLETQRAIRRIL